MHGRARPQWRLRSKSWTSSPLDLTTVREDVNSHFRLNECSAVCVAVGPSIVPNTPTVSFPREASLYIRGPCHDVMGRYFLPLGYHIQTNTAQYKGPEGNVSATITRNGGITCLGCSNGRIHRYGEECNRVVPAGQEPKTCNMCQNVFWGPSAAHNTQPAHKAALAILGHHKGSMVQQG